MTIFKINKILIFLRNMHHQSCHSYQIPVRMSETREYGCRFMNHTILTAICHFCPLLCVSYTSRMRILEQSGSGRMLMTVNDGQIHKIKGILWGRCYRSLPTCCVFHCISCHWIDCTYRYFYYTVVIISFIIQGSIIINSSPQTVAQSSEFIDALSCLSIASHNDSIPCSFQQIQACYIGEYFRNVRSIRIPLFLGQTVSCAYKSLTVHAIHS